MRKELIEQMVRNYFSQIVFVGIDFSNTVSLKEYLLGIKETSDIMTNEEVDYGVFIGNNLINN